MKTNVILVSAVLLLIILACSMASVRAEGFGLLSPGAFPCSTDNPELYGDYPVKKDPGATGREYSNLWTEYPAGKVGSYAQATNNIKYWKNPNNGSCIRADMCNGIYTDKTLDIPAHPPMLAFGEGIRVNYYDSSVSASED